VAEPAARRRRADLPRRSHGHGARALWSTHALIDSPDTLVEIHRDYADAGAEILTAASFRTQRRTLARAEGDAAAMALRDLELTRLAVDLARQGAAASRDGVLVAGSAPPLEDCYLPGQAPDGPSLEREHVRHTENLAAAGVDLILVETMNNVAESVAACRAARATGLPFMISFVSWSSASLLSGEPLAEAIDAVLPHSPVAVLVNCLPPSAVEACLPVLRASGLPFGVYANLGAPESETGFERREDCDPREFETQVSRWTRRGARLVGGCCGTTPDHIRAIACSLTGK